MTSEPALEVDQVEVRLLRFPLRAYARATEHYEDLFREFALMATSTSEHRHAVPGRLTALIETLGRRYPPQAAAVEERAAALARGELVGDFVLTLPRSGAEASAILDETLDEADDYCRAGDLLTLAAPAQVVEFRRWYLQEVIAQVAGRPPTPWPGGLD
jgi:hypothetical protein